jgi:phospholipid/cholesterol/gamma-HCH transport system substrate-binding protein
MRTRFRHEVSVGLFVVAAALLLGYISLKISRTRVRDGVDVAFIFPHACGLVKDSPVAVSGVEVGYVTGLRLREGKALVQARLSAAAGLRKDLRATIRSKSLLGEPYLELIPSGGSAPLLRNGDLVTATASPVQIDQMVSWIGRLLEQIEPRDAARFLNALSQDPEALRRIVTNADDLLGRLSATDAEALKKFVQELRIRARLF